MNRLVLAAALLPAAPWAADGPLDASAGAPAVGYSSAFADYRPYDEAARADWREVNRAVEEAARKSGGAHAGHGEAPRAPAPLVAPTGPAAGSASGTGHPGHGMHGGAR